MQLDRFPRVRLAHAPTPLEPLPNLSRHLDGPNIFIKRDDCTGLATGGNKARKLEFLIAEALGRGATHIVTQGATQSNHVRQTAAAAGKFGLRCTALLEERVAQAPAEYYQSGNVLLDRLLGCSLETRAAGADLDRELEEVAARLRERGEVPYLIPGGGSNPVGALGYAACAQELLAQANDTQLRVDRVVHATGSAGTQAGLVAGLEALHSGIRVTGISVRAPRREQEEKVRRLAQQTLGLLGVSEDLCGEAVEVDSDYVGAGYGQPTAGMVEALSLVAQLEGILLDPVYTGKAMAGLMGLIRAGRLRKGENVVFLHTGGSAGLFGYTSQLAAPLP